MSPLRKLSFGKIPCVLLIVGKRFNCSGFATFYKENGRTEICYKILTSMKNCRAPHRGSYAHSLNSMITRFKSKNLYWQTDNAVTTSIIGSGSNKVKLQNLALEIYDLTRNNNISLNIESILRELN